MQPHIPRGWNPIADAEARREAEHDMREAREIEIGREIRASSIYDAHAEDVLGDIEGAWLIAAIRKAVEDGDTDALSDVWDRLIEITAERLAADAPDEAA